jgi:hypothetical protein
LPYARRRSVGRHRGPSRLSGPEIAEACQWAIRTLLADLHARKGRPLAD